MTDRQVQILEQEYEKARDLGKDLEVHWEDEEIIKSLGLENTVLLETGLPSSTAIMNCWTLIHLREKIRNSERGLFTNHIIVTFLFFSESHCMNFYIEKYSESYLVFQYFYPTSYNALKVLANTFKSWFKKYVLVNIFIRMMV